MNNIPVRKEEPNRNQLGGPAVEKYASPSLDARGIAQGHPQIRKGSNVNASYRIARRKKEMAKLVGSEIRSPLEEYRILLVNEMGSDCLPFIADIDMYRETDLVVISETGCILEDDKELTTLTGQIVIRGGQVTVAALGAKMYRRMSLQPTNRIVFVTTPIMYVVAAYLPTAGSQYDDEYHDCLRWIRDHLDEFQMDAAAKKLPVFLCGDLNVSIPSYSPVGQRDRGTRLRHEAVVRDLRSRNFSSINVLSGSDATYERGGGVLDQIWTDQKMDRTWRTTIFVTQRPRRDHKDVYAIIGRYPDQGPGSGQRKKEKRKLAERVPSQIKRVPVGVEKSWTPRVWRKFAMEFESMVEGIHSEDLDLVVLDAALSEARKRTFQKTHGDDDVQSPQRIMNGMVAKVVQLRRKAVTYSRTRPEKGKEAWEQARAAENEMQIYRETLSKTDMWKVAQKRTPPERKIGQKIELETLEAHYRKVSVMKRNIPNMVIPSLGWVINEVTRSRRRVQVRPHQQGNTPPTIHELERIMEKQAKSVAPSATNSTSRSLLGITQHTKKVHEAVLREWDLETPLSKKLLLTVFNQKPKDGAFEENGATVPNNYRSLAVQSPFVAVMNRIPHERFRQHLSSMISPMQTQTKGLGISASLLTMRMLWNSIRRGQVNTQISEEVLKQISNRLSYQAIRAEKVESVQTIDGIWEMSIEEEYFQLLRLSALNMVMEESLGEYWKGLKVDERVTTLKPDGRQELRALTIRISDEVKAHPTSKIVNSTLLITTAASEKEPDLDVSRWIRIQESIRPIYQREGEAGKVEVHTAGTCIAGAKEGYPTSSILYNADRSCADYGIDALLECGDMSLPDMKKYLNATRYTDDYLPPLVETPHAIYVRVQKYRPEELNRLFVPASSWNVGPSTPLLNMSFVDDGKRLVFPYETCEKMRIAGAAKFSQTYKPGSGVVDPLCNDTDYRYLGVRTDDVKGLHRRIEVMRTVASECVTRVRYVRSLHSRGEIWHSVFRSASFFQLTLDAPDSEFLRVAGEIEEEALLEITRAMLEAPDASDMAEVYYALGISNLPTWLATQCIAGALQAFATETFSSPLAHQGCVTSIGLSAAYLGKMVIPRGNRVSCRPRGSKVKRSWARNDDGKEEDPWVPYHPQEHISRIPSGIRTDDITGDPGLYADQLCRSMSLFQLPEIPTSPTEKEKQKITAACLFLSLVMSWSPRIEVTTLGRGNRVPFEELVQVAGLRSHLTPKCIDQLRRCGWDILEIARGMYSAEHNINLEKTLCPWAHIPPHVPPDIEGLGFVICCPVNCCDWRSKGVDPRFLWTIGPSERGYVLHEHEVCEGRQKIEEMCDHLVRVHGYEDPYRKLQCEYQIARSHVLEELRSMNKILEGYRKTPGGLYRCTYCDVWSSKNVGEAVRHYGVCRSQTVTQVKTGEEEDQINPQNSTKDDHPEEKLTHGQRFYSSYTHILACSKCGFQIRRDWGLIGTLMPLKALRAHYSVCHPKEEFQKCRIPRGEAAKKDHQKVLEPPHPPYRFLLQEEIPLWERNLMKSGQDRGSWAQIFARASIGLDMHKFNKYKRRKYNLARIVGSSRRVKPLIMNNFEIASKRWDHISLMMASRHSQAMENEDTRMPKIGMLKCNPEEREGEQEACSREIVKVGGGVVSLRNVSRGVKYTKSARTRFKKKNRLIRYLLRKYPLNQNLDADGSTNKPRRTLHVANALKKYGEDQPNCPSKRQSVTKRKNTPKKCKPVEGGPEVKQHVERGERYPKIPQQIQRNHKDEGRRPINKKISDLGLQEKRVKRMTVLDFVEILDSVSQ